ncbi:hypothetical protein RvY_07212 [Ramazzottius varieornatus]|uniref:MATH domain-containing protein n=1 Tax=Ramazzottius varieornatus TaxID=947166 RepID=A0A1D1V9U2_RAMVA|nr:hypothetical protein RvY_07212 [Ramazzottius varieornatus]
MTCTVDFTIILYNREHFSRNEIYHIKNAVFTTDCPTQACPNFVGLEDLLSRQFTDEQTEFIVDLVLKNPRTTYEDSIQMPSRLKGRPIERLESSYFAFGNLEWNLVLMPTAAGTLVKLNRMTHFEHSCQTKFRILVGSPTNAKHSRFVSSLQESISDLAGTGESIMLNIALEDYIEGNQLKIGVEMFSANLLSEIILPGLQQVMHFYDRDKQTWHMQLGTLERGETEYLKVNLSYDDVKQVPRDHARYISWKLHVRPVNINATSKTEIVGPFCKYYQQRDVDFSYEIATHTPLTQVTNRSTSGRDAFAAPEGLTENSYIVLVEWLHIHLLLPSQFHHYDDLHRMQYHQMRLEFATVQAESYNLERTLLQYQHGFHPNNAVSLKAANHSTSENEPQVNGF